MLARAEPSLDLGITQVRITLDEGPRCVEESGYFFVSHNLPVSSFESEHIYVIPSAFIAAVMGSEKKIGSTRSTMSPEIFSTFGIDYFHLPHSLKLFERTLPSIENFSSPSSSINATDFPAYLR